MESQSSSFNETKKIDYSPKGILLEFPFVFDFCVKNFIDDFQSLFVKKKKSGVFALSKSFSKKTLETLFSEYVFKNIDRIAANVSQTHSDWQNVFVIVSDSGNERRASFEMLEKDIDIGLNKIVSVAETIFKKHFIELSLRNKDKKLIWCKHNFLSAHDWEAICEKKVFGKKNFISWFSDKESVAVKEVLNNSEIEKLTSQEQKLIVEEATEWLRSQV